MSKLLRGVLVTNQGTEWEAVILAMESRPWHMDPSKNEACQDKECKRDHRVHAKFSDGEMIFDFDSRQVYPAGGTNSKPNHHKCNVFQTPQGERKDGFIPEEDLAKFNADFGLYYSS